MKTGIGLQQRLMQILTDQGRDHFTSEEVRHWLEEERQPVNDLLCRLTATGSLQRLRRGLYQLAGSPEGKVPSAPRLRQPEAESSLPFFLQTVDRQGCLSFRSAMEFHLGQATEPPWYFVTLRRHRPTRQRDGEIRFMTRSRSYLYDSIHRDGLRISSLEKTWADCLHRPDHAGGFERLLAFLVTTRDRLDPLRLQDVLRRYPGTAPLRRLLSLTDALRLDAGPLIQLRPWQRKGNLCLDPALPPAGTRHPLSGVLINLPDPGILATPASRSAPRPSPGHHRESLRDRIRSADPAIAAKAIQQALTRRSFNLVCEELSPMRKTLLSRFGATRIDQWLKRLLENNLAARGHLWLFAFRAQAIALKGNPDRAVDWMQSRMHLLEGTPEERFAHYILGNLAMLANRLPLAALALENALKLDEQTGQVQQIAQDRMALGTLAGIREDYPTARARYRQSLEIYRQLGERDNEFMVLCNIGSSLLTEGSAYQAAECFAEARNIAGNLGNPMLQVTLSLHRAEVATTRGDGRVAIAQYQEAARLQRMMQLEGGRFDTLAALLRCQLRHGRISAATDTLRRLEEQRQSCPQDERFDRIIQLRRIELALCRADFAAGAAGLESLPDSHPARPRFILLQTILSGNAFPGMDPLPVRPRQSRDDQDHQWLLEALRELSCGNETGACEITRPVLEQMRQHGRQPGWDEWFYPLYLALIPRREERRARLTGTPTRWRRQPASDLTQYCRRLLQSQGRDQLRDWLDSNRWLPTGILAGLRERLPRIDRRPEDPTWLLWTRDGCLEADSEDLRQIRQLASRDSLLYDTIRGELQLPGRKATPLSARTIPGKLLTHLLRHAGVPLEARELYRDIWDDPILPDTAVRTLQVHIASLRRLLEPYPGRPERLLTARTSRGDVAYQLSRDEDFCLILSAEEF